MNESDTMRQILADTQTIAVVGLSPDPMRPSYDVARAMQARGYRIIPINPLASGILGETAYPSLTAAALHHRIDLVNCFRRSAYIPAIVDEAIAIQAKAIWMQLGVSHTAAALQAQAAGLLVVQNKCIMVEHRLLSARGQL